MARGTRYYRRVALQNSWDNVIVSRSGGRSQAKAAHLAGLSPRLCSKANRRWQRFHGQGIGGGGGGGVVSGENRIVRGGCHFEEFRIKEGSECRWEVSSPDLARLDAIRHRSQLRVQS